MEGVQLAQSSTFQAGNKRHLSYRQPIELNIPIILSSKYNNLSVNNTFQLRS